MTDDNTQDTVNLGDHFVSFTVFYLHKFQRLMVKWT